ncbi:MAG: magnesium/cobalt transporter CorA [Planctomycetota bacterium]|nr:magnesium/cobalt transporter CorA [Planctomycetota bacterium]
MSRKRPGKQNRRSPFKRRSKPGAAPGTMIVDPQAPKPRVRLIAFGPDEFLETEVEDLEKIAQIRGRFPVIWVNVDGLGDASVLSRLQKIFGLHPLAMEDVVNSHQRPKVESYDGQLFIIARELTVRETCLENDQLAIFVGQGFVISFQEIRGDCFDPVRARIRDRSGQFRSRGPDYLCYTLIDAVVDSYFPTVESLGEKLEAAEESILRRPCEKDLVRLHDLKRDLLLVRRAAWPLREAIGSLIRDRHPLITESTLAYLRDAADHTVQIIDLVETDRELCSDLRDIYLSSVSMRMNQIVKVLTIISTIFIPLTFLAGVYGMNFDPAAGPLSMPELRQPLGYAGFWGVCLLIAVSLLGLFAWLGWLGERSEP